MLSSVLRKKYTTRSVQDHDMGLTRKYAMAIGVKEKPNPPQDPNSQNTSQARVH